MLKPDSGPHTGLALVHAWAQLWSTLRPDSGPHAGLTLVHTQAQLWFWLNPDSGTSEAWPWFSYGSTLVLTEARLVLSPNSGSKVCRWSSRRPLCSSALCLTCQHSGYLLWTSSWAPVCLWPLTLFLFPNPLFPGPSQHACTAFSSCWSHHRGLWYGSTLLVGWGHIIFSAPSSPPAHVQRGKLSLSSGLGILPLYPSRAQLLPLALSLDCLGENKASTVLHSTDQLSSLGTLCLLP